jgi:hypothetical protein
LASYKKKVLSLIGYYTKWEQQFGPMIKRGDNQCSSQVNLVWEILWKLQVPSKIIFYLENPAWCGIGDGYSNLLFGCGLAKLTWQVVLCAFQLVRPPDRVDDLFGGWIKSFPKNQRNLVLCGAGALCWILWKTRNDAYFNKKYPNDPTDVIYRLFNVLTGWAFLQTYQDRGKVEEGVNKLKTVIREAYARSHGWAPGVLRIMN